MAEPKNSATTALQTLDQSVWENGNSRCSQFIRLNEQNPVVEGIVAGIRDEDERVKNGEVYSAQTVLTILFADGSIKKLGLPSYYGFLHDIKTAFFVYGPNRVAIRLKCIDFEEIEGKENKKRVIDPRMVILNP